jgi:ATP-dependent Lhr-like helicase
VRGEASNAFLDDFALRNLTAYVEEQREATGAVPTDRTIVVECFRDELGDWRVCLLSPLGSRVLAPWGLALEAAYERLGADVNVLWTDDGVCLRFPDVEELPPLDGLFPDPDEVEELVVEQLAGSALFASRFRENAARALLLPRRRGKGRTPLWQQRLKAQNLQQVAMGFPGFPIVLETYRECLQEAFDLPSLVTVLRGVQQRTIGVHEVVTKRPSPFARSLAFAFVAAFMYAGDAPLAERRAQALTLDRDLLRDLLGGEQLRELLDPTALAELEAELQRLLPERRVRSADALHDLLRRLGELSDDELQARTDGDAQTWLRELEAARRAVPVRLAGQVRWVAVEDAGLYRDGLGVALPPGLPGAFLDAQQGALQRLVVRWGKVHGPFLPEPLAERWGVPVGAVVAVLEALTADGRLVHGEMRPGGVRAEWCDPEVLRRLRRRSLARARQEVEPVDAQVYTRFLLSWHGVGGRAAGLDRLRQVVTQLQGAALPASQLDALLGRRVASYRPEQLDQLGAMGEVVWVGRGSVGARDGRVALYQRATVHLLLDEVSPPDELFDTDDGALRRTLLEHLEQRGASFAAELLAVGEGASLASVVSALWALVWAGLVTNDTFAPLRQLGTRRKRIGEVPGAGGRWSATSSLRRVPATDTARALARAQMLLERYGIASSAAAQADGLVGGFSSVYPVLRELEASGKVRRGWFVDGIEGAQFASAGVVDRLRGHRSEEEGEPVVLPATDPANPYGVVLPWPATEGRPRRALGYEVVWLDGQGVLFVDRSGKKVITLHPEVSDADWARCYRAWASAGRRRRREIERIDGETARSGSRSAGLKAEGFVETYKGLALPDS